MASKDDSTKGEGPTRNGASGQTPPANAPSQPPPASAPGPGAQGADATEVPDGDELSDDEGKFFVVGIGASAGGLEALGKLLRHVPLDCMAFVVVQHLAPDHTSMLAQLLSRESRLAVVPATDGVVLEPNCVFVIPPNADLSVSDRVIHVEAANRRDGPHLSVDHFFRSLADDQGDRAIGIVLSGTGTDGTRGLAAIKAAGGFTFVQDPSTAKYEGMPSSALASGTADYCLSPEDIGRELARIGQQTSTDRKTPPERPAFGRDKLAKLFALVRAEFGTDLTQYKGSTIDRRIERRMMMHRLDRFDDYVRLVQQNRSELCTLHKDMLISVTSFFRDRDAFAALETKILPQLLRDRDPSQAIRVWVPACATGEEAYSIAICLLELCEENVRGDRIQIFGTDIDADSIQVARRGVYPANIDLDVPPARLKRYFTKRNDEYHVSRRVRDMLVFSQQNVLKDAPFSRLDLVSCRNLLIYLQSAAQKHLLRTLHYSLNPSGYLLLGTSETVGDAPDLFSCVDRKHKIYAKKHVAHHGAVDIAFGSRTRPEAKPVPEPYRPSLSLRGLADRKVLDMYAPPGVVVSEHLDILHFRGHTGPYLDPAPGVASLNLLKVARFELHMDLKRALHEALSGRVRVTTDVSFHEEGRLRLVQLDVLPLEDPDTRAPCLLVLFRSVPPPKEVAVPTTEHGQDDAFATARLDERIAELERELAVTKEYLQTVVEEKESTLEELQSANEELQSSNEELQSTNEELETSKEEMQSTNEELTTVNDELQSRMVELSQTNDDLHNVLAGVENPVVIVGMDLRIRRFTGAAERLFNLVPADVGRTIGYLDSFLGTSPLEAKVSAVINDLSALNEEVLASNQRWYSLKISPYKTLDHSIRGALVNLSDIDVRKRATEMTRDVAAYAAAFLGAIGHPLLIVDRTPRVVWANDVFLTRFQLSRDETVGSTLATLGSRQFSDPDLRARIEQVFSTAAIVRDHDVRLRYPDGRETMVRIGASQIPASSDTRLALVLVEPLTPRPAPEGDAP